MTQPGLWKSVKSPGSYSVKIAISSVIISCRLNQMTHSALLALLLGQSGIAHPNDYPLKKNLLV